LRENRAKTSTWMFWRIKRDSFHEKLSCGTTQ
jgi:hypothetical protein